MASNGQVFTHLPQPIQEALQTLLATAPLSRFTHITTIRRFFGPFGRSSMTLRGQVLTQAPQAVQRSSSTSGNPVSGLMHSAPNWHAATQSPPPKQPNAHAVSPVPANSCTRQLPHADDWHKSRCNAQRRLSGYWP